MKINAAEKANTTTAPTLSSLGPLPTPRPISLEVGTATLTLTPIVPYETLFDSIEWAVSIIVDDRSFISAPLRRIITDIAAVRTFTNLNLTIFDDPNTLTPQKVYELYDILAAHRIPHLLAEHADHDQYSFFCETILETATSIAAYRNSAVGIVDIVAAKSKESSTNIDSALSVFQDPEKLAHVQKMADLISATLPPAESNS